MIWCIEPHFDDCYLSLHEHMRSWVKRGMKVGILTVFNKGKRYLEGEAYAKKFGFTCEFLMCPEGAQGLGSNPSYELGDLETWIDEHEDDRLILPLGMQHPDHKAVASYAPDYCWRYLDTPYQAKQKLHEELNDLLHKYHNIESLMYPNKRKWNHIPIFKSQSKFFHFNPAESMYHIPEIIVSA